MLRVAHRMLASLVLVTPCAGAGELFFQDGFENRFVINEIVTDDAQAGPDAVEFFNAGSVAVDIGGWSFIDNDPTHVPYTFPPGTIVPPGAYLVVYRDDVVGFGFGLSALDSILLFTDAQDLHDDHTWQEAAAAPTTHSRCPNGSGSFAITTPGTLGTTNSCP